MTLSQLALTIALLAALGLVAGRFGLSAIPAYLLAGLLLGPHEPHVTSLIEPSEVTTFVAELGIIFLLFFLGLEFTVDRLLRSGRHIGLGGSIDLTVNAAVGLLVGVIAFGFGFPALILAAAIYVSSSAVTVKGLIDFRRLAERTTSTSMPATRSASVVAGARSVGTRPSSAGSHSSADHSVSTAPNLSTRCDSGGHPAAASSWTSSAISAQIWAGTVSSSGSTSPLASRSAR